MRYDVSITHDDIIFGMRNDMHKCPVARAIFRAFKADEVRAHHDYVSIYKFGKPATSIGFSEAVQTWIVLYDKGCDVQPFEFHLELDWPDVPPKRPATDFLAQLRARNDRNIRA